MLIGLVFFLVVWGLLTLGNAFPTAVGFVGLGMLFTIIGMLLGSAFGWLKWN